jgi:hypothetical protein
MGGWSQLVGEHSGVAAQVSGGDVAAAEAEAEGGEEGVQHGVVEDVDGQGGGGEHHDGGDGSEDEHGSPLSSTPRWGSQLQRREFPLRPVLIGWRPLHVRGGGWRPHGRA